MRRPPLASPGSRAGSRLRTGLLFCLLIIPSIVGSAGISAAAEGNPAPRLPARFKERIPGKDVTPEFDARYGRAESKALDAREKKRLVGYQIILVPGIVTSLYLQIGNFLKDTIDMKDVLDYLREAREALAELGQLGEQPLLKKEEFNTQQTVAVNAERIVREVRKQVARGKRVILLSHSKGGNDALAALLLLQKSGELGSVGGWISLQGVFEGTPIADEIMQSDPLRKGAQLAFEQLGGTLDSLRDITTEAGVTFLAQNKAAIRKLNRSLPILSFASWKEKPADPQLLRPDTALVPTRDLLSKRGLLNDGLVPTRSAILPYSLQVVKGGIDHAEPAMTNQPPVPPSTLNKKQLVQALLGMLLVRMKPAAKSSAAR